MDQHLVWLIILLVVGVIVSNLMVLKYTSKFKWPTPKDDSYKNEKTPDDDSTDADSAKTDRDHKGSG